MSEKVAIVGSRDYADLEAVREYVNALPVDTVIVSGGARGVDRCAEEAAKARGMTTDIHRADWAKHGKAAGVMRNHDIVANADRVVAFWDGKSKGTAHTISLALQCDMDVEIIASRAASLPDGPRTEGGST